MDFYHLHVHSDFSLYRSTVRIRPLVEKASSLGMKSVALTDHGNLFGAVKFAAACKEFGIKPIIGAEVTVADESAPGMFSQLVLLCRTREGFSNLRNIISRSYLEGVVGGSPTTTMEILSGNHAGLTALSGCLQGEVPQAVLRGDITSAVGAATKWNEVFEKGNFFLELEGSEQEEQATVNSALARISRDTGIPLVATNNVHYLNPEDAVAQAVLVAVQRHDRLDDNYLRNLPGHSFHFAAQSEMAVRFADHPEALENTVRIAESVAPDVVKPSQTLHFPIFDTPSGKEPSDVLAELAGKGLSKRIEKARGRGEDVDEDAYMTRLDMELQRIIRLGFEAYFLVVADFIEWARSQNIPVGPGRGSGAGSLVAYSLGITDIDPIGNGLLFERFINMEYLQPPDFDVDFSLERQHEVIDYVVRKYGHEHVARIGAFATMVARPALRAVAGVVGVDAPVVEGIIEAIPIHPRITLKRAIKEVPDLAAIADGTQGDPKLKEFLDMACRLEGLAIEVGIHAAGIVIADRPVSDYVPMFRTDEGRVATQYDMRDLDAVGLVRFDFLGLDALTIIDDAVRSIRSATGGDFRIEDVPLDDRKTYEMLASGATDGVFQLASPGITELVKRVKPDCFDDIVAILALYRPGPLGEGMLDDFIRFKHVGRPNGHVEHDTEPILNETHGVIIYQEQLMRIAAEVAGFSLDRADLLRRALGKKKGVDAFRDEFIEGATGLGVPRNRALELFQRLEKHAEYGFNKSHSASYALLTYCTAYLKANHPKEFTEALLAAERRDEDMAQ